MVLLPRRCFRQPPEEEQIVFFNCIDVCHKPPDSGERLYKSRTWKSPFDGALSGGCLDVIFPMLLPSGVAAASHSSLSALALTLLPLLNP